MNDLRDFVPEHRYIETNIDKKNDSANNLLVPEAFRSGYRLRAANPANAETEPATAPQPDSGPQATRTERTENGDVFRPFWQRIGIGTNGTAHGRPQNTNHQSTENMKTIALIGASGFVGSASSERKRLYRDLQVTAIVRRPGKHRAAEPKSRNADGRRSRPDDPEGSRPQPRRGNQRLQPGLEQSRHLRTDAERLSAHRRGSQAGRHKTAAGRRRSRQPVRRARA